MGETLYPLYIYYKLYGPGVKNTHHYNCHDATDAVSIVQPFEFYCLCYIRDCATKNRTSLQVTSYKSSGLYIS